MYEQEKIKPYGDEGEKSEQVERMFDNIAPRYDKLNHLMSFDIDKRWRRKSILQLEPYHPRRILDIATGTGDYAILTAQLLRPEHLTATDISEGMMDIGRKKVEEKGLQQVITFAKEDCMKLTIPDNSYDAVTAAFGIRNFADLDQGLREMCRVLKSGGHVSIVELTHPTRFPMKQLFKVYSRTILPLWGKIISKDMSAYSYLSATIAAFPQGETMTEALHRAGFTAATFKRLTFGICTMYFATKP